jgi:methionine biosynthesis protein MetW
VARLDYQMIEDMVPDGATVLDLGCGDGELLGELIEKRHVHGSGVDISPSAVEACVARGLSVFHGDLDEGLADFDDGSFDVVILSFSLQQLHKPRLVVREMARVGKLVIVSFPNFAHWWARVQLFFLGRMPVSGELPFQWYDTPNIHLCTIRDFRLLCRH